MTEPEPPSSAWSIAGNESLQIYWTPPNPYTCVVSYRITFSLDGKPEITSHTNDTQIIIDKLKSCSVYEVNIIPVHKMGDSKPIIINSNQTFPPGKNCS